MLLYLNVRQNKTEHEQNGEFEKGLLVTIIGSGAPSPHTDETFLQLPSYWCRYLGL